MIVGRDVLSSIMSVVRARRVHLCWQPDKTGARVRSDGRSPQLSVLPFMLQAGQKPSQVVVHGSQHYAATPSTADVYTLSTA